MLMFRIRYVQHNMQCKEISAWGVSFEFGQYTEGVPKTCASLINIRCAFKLESWQVDIFGA